MRSMIGDIQPCFGATGAMASPCICRDLSERASHMIHSVIVSSDAERQRAILNMVF
jgi:hypothetical protein